MLTKSIKKFFSTFKSFSNHKEIQRFLDSQKPVLSCLYFRADWNPQCSDSDQIFEQVSAKYPGYTFVKVDTEADDYCKKVFGVKYEPEFVICCLGAEMTRHIGLNASSLESKLNKYVEALQKTVVADHYREVDFIGDARQYEPFQKQFLDDYEENEKEEDHWLR